MGHTILQVIPRLDAGGAERTSVEIVEALMAHGHRALVACAGGRLVAEVEAAGGEVILLPLETKNPFLLHVHAGRLADIARQHGVDLIHARSRAPAWSALWAARRMKIPFVTTYHGIYNSRSPLKRLYNSVMARGDRVIANSVFTAAHLIAEHAIPPERVITIPRGVDLTRFDPRVVSPDRTGALASAWGLTARAQAGPVLLLPGRLTRWKGQAICLEALARIKGRAWTAVFVGDDQGRSAYRAELEAQIAASGLDGRVKLTGHCSDMPAALALADCVLAPSLEAEAFGRVAPEAGAMGKPVIVSDLGGQRETVIEGVTGWRTPPGDVAALAAALEAFLDLDDDARLAMGTRAADHVRTRYSAAAMQSATLKVYDMLLAGRGGA